MIDKIQQFKDWLMWDWVSIIGMLGMVIAAICMIVMMFLGVKFSLFGTITTRRWDE